LFLIEVFVFGEIEYMTHDRELRPLSSYLEFGLRLHWEDFSQLTTGALLIYLPISVLVIFIHPPIEAIVKPTEGMSTLLPRMVISQLLLRVLQTFVLIMIILRIEARRNSGENVWDFSEAVSRVGRVALVDLAYVFGLQIMGIAVFGMALMIVGLLFGDNPLTLPVSFLVSAFLVVGPAVRYYFSSYVSLFLGTSFIDSFKRAATISAGGERLIVALVMTFLIVWFVVWQIFQGIFGGGVLGQLMVQAGVMTTSIPYFIATYLLFFDLVPPEEERTPSIGTEIPGFSDASENPEKDYPST
jgi:hypothetical protein